MHFLDFFPVFLMLLLSLLLNNTDLLAVFHSMMKKVFEELSRL